MGLSLDPAVTCPAASCRRPRRFAGYSTTELAIATALVGILSSVAAPSMHDLLQDNRNITQMNKVVRDLYLARSEAIKRGEMVTLCKSSTGTACTTASAWHEGWIVFVDRDEDHALGGDEPVLRAEAAFGAEPTLKLNAFGSANYISYQPTGITNTNGTFSFCDTRGAAKARSVIYYKSGRVRTGKRKADGSALTCP